MATKNNPSEYDCYQNAEPDEPIFVLVARDITAPDTIRDWCKHRVQEGKNGADDDQIQAALGCANLMEDWYMKNR